MEALITFTEHPVEAPEGHVFFTPPYLMKREAYSAIFAVLQAHKLSVTECCRQDLEMTRENGGRERVFTLMVDKLHALQEQTVIDVGMSLGAGFTALARKKSQTEPAARLVLSPVPDPVTPWDKEVFADPLNRLNNQEIFIPGKGNYDLLTAIKKSNYSLDSSVPTHVIAEDRSRINTNQVIDDWARHIQASVTRCSYFHGTSGRRLLVALPNVLEALKSET